MAITVAPLTTTVMAAVDSRHAGVASGVNNAVARIAGLLAIAVFGFVLVRAFDAQVKSRADRMALAASARVAIERELPKMAAAELQDIPLDSPERDAVRHVIEEAFVSAFRLVMLAAAALAVTAGAAGAAIRT